MKTPLQIPDVGFPDPRHAPEHGLLAVGGEFSPQVLLAAYSRGIFPWPSDLFPHAWYSPDPRFVLFPDRLHVSRSLRKNLRRGVYRVTFDTAFEQVIHSCAQVPRAHQDGTWISTELTDGFLELHRMGLAHSAECWQGDDLVGGAYGLALGGAFCGESMFAHRPDASKVAFVRLVQRLQRHGFHFVDCQVHTEHLERFGAEEMERDEFLDRLQAALKVPGAWPRGPWTDEPPTEKL